MIKILPSNAGGVGSIPGWETEIPYVLWLKNQNIKKKKPRSNIVTNSIKTLKCPHETNLKKNAAPELPAFLEFLLRILDISVTLFKYNLSTQVVRKLSYINCLTLELQKQYGAILDKILWVSDSQRMVYGPLVRKRQGFSSWAKKEQKSFLSPLWGMIHTSMDFHLYIGSRANFQNPLS